MKLLCLLVLMAMSAPISFLHGTVAGVPVHQVEIDLTSQNLYVTVCLSKGHGESFDSMTKRLSPLAAITGGFYDTKTFKPIGDIVIDGKIIHDGCIGPAFIVSALDNSVQIVSQEEYRTIPKNTLRLGIQTGPTLVKDGKIALDPGAEGFHIARSAQRTAIGLTADGKLILIATDVPIYLYKLADVMLKAGCISAVTLDGGGSTGIYYDGKVKVHPARLMVSLLVILPKN